MVNPLETVLRPIADTLNRNIAEITPARELAGELNGSSVGIRVRDSSLAMYFLFDEDAVNLTTEFAVEPDVVISGSPITLARMMRGGGESAIRSGDVELTGDAATAQRFQKLLDFAKPDVEEELSRFIGDIAAHRIGEFARGVGDWARDTRATMRDNVREYLQEESRSLPTRYEVERFADDVSVLRDDVERIAARIDRLKADL